MRFAPTRIFDPNVTRLRRTVTTKHHQIHDFFGLVAQKGQNKLIAGPRGIHATFALFHVSGLRLPNAEIKPRDSFITTRLIILKPSNFQTNHYLSDPWNVIFWHQSVS
ncbi:unnamed protein product [Sphacelaria rigidula]